ncbi:MAG TPA: hypothetical protein VM911_01150 [Pyrinomonadaceae bacterium]|nr:hypothetical protein [Pyrinomonadaceae bacterium]
MLIAARSRERLRFGLQAKSHTPADYRDVYRDSLEISLQKFSKALKFFSNQAGLPFSKAFRKFQNYGGGGLP